MNQFTRCLTMLAALAGAIVVPTAAVAAEPTAEDVQMLSTPDGTRFAVLGTKPAAPAPTLLVFGGDHRGTLLSEDVNWIGRLLAAKGFLSVALSEEFNG